MTVATANYKWGDIDPYQIPDVPSDVNRLARDIDASVRWVETKADTAGTKSDAALKTGASNSSRLSQLEPTVASQGDRVRQLETLGQLQPGSVNDATAAGLILQPDSATAAALGATVASRQVQETARRQASLYADFMLKLRTGLPVKICALGDSLTYGHDEVSADRVAAPTGPMPDGTFHENMRSPKPWPTVLASHLSWAFPAGVTTINRGRTGDTVTKAWGRWPVTSGADLTVISFGTNDQAHLTVQQFIEGYERLILREINDYNAAVVILSPLRVRTSSGTASIDVYRNALDALANKYSLPVIDGQELLAGYRDDIYSDSWHLNTAGYNIVGSRLAACFIGWGPEKPHHVGPGTRLSVRETLDNMLAKGGARLTSPGVGIRMDGASSLVYSFYTDVADVVIVPYYYIGSGNTLEFKLDFGAPQPPKLQDIYATSPAVPPSVVSHAPTSHVTHTALSSASKVLTVASPGWHTLEIKGTGGTAFPTVQYIYYLELLDYRGYQRAIA